ncbi:MAG: KTSC domain-containing protein [Bacteroidota bacterium]
MIINSESGPVDGWSILKCLVSFWHSPGMPSSVIKHMSYNSTSHTLRITYVSGTVYDYKDVPEAVFDEMKKASSRGEYLNHVIKKKYHYKKVV